MQNDHRQILKDKSYDISKRVSLEYIKHFLSDYKLFNKYMWLDIKSTSDVLNLLPTRGPKAFDNMVEILRKAGYEKEADSLVDTVIMKIDKKLIYKMSSPPLGHCLIINNVNFSSGKPRDGSDVDAQSLKTFFESINYKVFTKRNLEADDMRNRIKEFSKSDFKRVDLSMVIILSHGNRVENLDVVMGTDGKIVYKKDIVYLFNNIDCFELQGKPKIFIFVACRGTSKDYGAPKNLFPSESLDSNKITALTPTLSDIFIVHSSLPDYVSVRDHDKGSWFCQDLVSVLKEYCCKYDIKRIMDTVSNKIMGRVSHLYGVTQTPHFESYGFNNHLFLCGNP